MSVIVVPVVVPVIVRVGLGAVMMAVLVSRTEHQPDTRRHQCPSHDLKPEHRLPQQHPRQGQTKEWGRREDHLRTSRPQLLCSPNIERERHAIAQATERQRGEQGVANAPQRVDLPSQPHSHGQIDQSSDRTLEEG